MKTNLNTPKGSLFECEVCGEVSPSYNGLMTHIHRQARKETHEFIFWEFARKGYVTYEETLLNNKHYKYVHEKQSKVCKDRA
jgi:hypothetical protein